MAGNGRIIMVHSYLAGRDVEIARGEAPCNLDWGMRALAAKGYEVILPQTEGETSWLRRLSRSLRGRIGHPDLEWRIWRIAGPGDIIYDVSGDLILLPFLRSVGLFRAPIVVWSYTSPAKPGWHSIHRWKQTRRFLRGIDGVCCLTERAANWCRARMPHARIRRVSWGVDTDFFQPARAAEGRWFVCCGRSERDFPTLLRAAEHGHFHIKMVVPRDVLGGTKLPPNVELAGGPATRYTEAGLAYRDLVADVYASARAFLIPLQDHPGNASGYTNLIESMAMGKAVVMTRTGCLDLDIEKEGIGIYVEPGDVDGWIKALKLLIESPKLAREMGERARRLAERDYSYDKFGVALCRLFSDLAHCR